MYYLRATSIIVLFAVANSLTTPSRAINDTLNANRRVPAGGTHLAAATLAACAAAPNCETYEHPVFGTHIRFVDGMGPGSAHYARAVVMRRDGDTRTNVTTGNNVLNYGSVKASGKDGAIHHLYDVCGPTACDTTPVTISSDFADLDSPWTGHLLLTASGQYASIDERNAFVAALVEMAAKGEKCWTQKWSHGQYNGGYSEGAVDMCKQSSFLNVNRFVGGFLQGWVSVRVELEETEGGWCATILGAIGDATGMLAGLPGMEPLGGAAVFFGLVSALCGQ